MISSKMNDLLNGQITKEYYSSYLYRQMSAWMSVHGLSVLEAWFQAQAQEEHEHALKFIDYVLKAGGQLRLGAIDAPPHAFESALQIAEKTLEHEQLVTRSIHALAAQADEDKDYSTRSYLQWYIDEQVEEEATVGELVQLARMAGDQLLLLEHRVERLVEKRAQAASA